jgi:hypothetical protein
MIGAAVGILFCILLYNELDGNFLVLLPIVPSLVVFIYYAFQYYEFRKKFKQQYKEEIIRTMIHKVNPELKYSPNKKISKEVFVKSGIFVKKPSNFKGDDLIEGKIGKTEFRFSELKATHTSSNGKGNSKTEVVFDGLFFEADFNKHFKEDLFVLEDLAEFYLGKFVNAFQKLNFQRPKLVKMENVEFENYFAVYGDDPIEARYILTPDMMSRIVELRKRVSQLNISFVKSSMFIAISDSDNNFEPSYFSSLDNYEKLEGYYLVLMLCLNLVEDFDLNTRIWTKD